MGSTSIDQDIEVDARGRFLRYSNVTPLCLAVLSHKVEVVAYLLEAGADAKYDDVRDAETGGHKTVLELASYDNEVARLLVDHGAIYVRKTESKYQGDDFFKTAFKTWLNTPRDETGDQSW